MRKAKRPKPAKKRVAPELAAARRELRREATKRRELEKRLAGSLEREKAAAEVLSEKDRALTEALEQQTATSEILHVISRSQTDVQPVFDTIVRSAVRLCNGLFSALYQFDGDLHYLVAQHNYTPEALEEVQRVFPARPTRALFTGRAILERAVVHIPNVELDPEFQHLPLSRAIGFQSGLFVPMLHEGAPIGVIVVARAETGPFSDTEIELLKTFADQAVIAIENARLFKELEKRNRDLTEALEQQTATAEILRVISRSQTDVQPVFDTIVRSAARLCDGLFSALFRFDGELLRQGAEHNFTPEALEELRRVFPARPTRALGTGRAILEGSVIHIPDVEVDPEYQHHAISRAIGYRSGLFVPMLRERLPIGVIQVSRAEARPFSDSEIELLKTFADQAVIAVENVRLFKELEARNRDLTEALEQQTATAEILRVISRSQTDVQPVFDTIVRSAVRLCDGLFSAVFQFDSELIHQVAQYNYTPEGLAEAHRIYPARPTRALLTGRAILERAVVHVPDVELDPEHQHHALSRAIGQRSLLCVPMLREGAPVGVILVARAEPGLFSDNEVELLKTFADQAVIAVENVRLFKELDADGRADPVGREADGAKRGQPGGELDAGCRDGARHDRLPRQPTGRRRRLLDLRVRRRHRAVRAARDAQRRYGVCRGAPGGAPPEGRRAHGTRGRDARAHPDPRHHPARGLPEQRPGHAHPLRIPGSPLCASAPRGSDHRQPLLQPEGAG